MNTRRTSPLPNPNNSINKVQIDYQSNYIELYNQRMKDFRRQKQILENMKKSFISYSSSIDLKFDQSQISIKTKQNNQKFNVKEFLQNQYFKIQKQQLIAYKLLDECRQLKIQITDVLTQKRHEFQKLKLKNNKSKNKQKINILRLTSIQLMSEVQQFEGQDKEEVQASLSLNIVVPVMQIDNVLQKTDTFQQVASQKKTENRIFSTETKRNQKSIQKYNIKTTVNRYTKSDRVKNHYIQQISLIDDQNQIYLSQKIKLNGATNSLKKNQREINCSQKDKQKLELFMKMKKIQNNRQFFKNNLSQIQQIENTKQKKQGKIKMKQQHNSLSNLYQKQSLIIVNEYKNEINNKQCITIIQDSD